MTPTSSYSFVRPPPTRIVDVTVHSCAADDDKTIGCVEAWPLEDSSSFLAFRFPIGRPESEWFETLDEAKSWVEAAGPIYEQARLEWIKEHLPSPRPPTYVHFSSCKVCGATVREESFNRHYAWHRELLILLEKP